MRNETRTKLLVRHRGGVLRLRQTALSRWKPRPVVAPRTTPAVRGLRR